jgi:hypothetical protein
MTTKSKITMNKLQPIYGTTMSGTETIIDKWLNGSQQSVLCSIKFIVDFCNDFLFCFFLF